MKFIREGRFGSPKTWKTGSIVDTYPTPMLLVQYDQDGVSVAKKRKPDILMPKEFQTKLLAAGSTWPDLTVVDLSYRTNGGMMTEKMVPVSEDTTLVDSVNVFNTLNKTRAAFPFKTIVVDPVTEMGKMIHRAISKTNEARLADPRKWAGDVGGKVSQFIENYCTLPCNVVFIFHSEWEKNEDLKTLRIVPLVHSKLREHLGGMFSQFFYQEINGGKPVVRTSGVPLVEGIGVRWPDFGTATLHEPTFQALYGKEPDVCK